MKYNEIERLQKLAGIITEIKVNNPLKINAEWINQSEGMLEVEGINDSYGVIINNNFISWNIEDEVEDFFTNKNIPYIIKDGDILVKKLYFDIN